MISNLVVLVLLSVCSLITVNANQGSSKDAGSNSTMNHFLHKHGLLKEEWDKGIEFERDFWSLWMETKGDKWSDDFENRVRKQRRIEERFVEAMPPVLPGAPKRTHALILDAGAGPMSLVGNWHPDIEIELIAVDPLSYLYNELLQKNNLVPHPRVGHAFVERVAELWPQGFFDVVHIQNSLDHSVNPLAGILNLLTVLKPKGKLLMKHGLDEALNEGWLGFHQWNFNTNKDGQFTIAKKDGSVIIVDDEVKGVATCKHEVNVERHKLTSECLKLG